MRRAVHQRFQMVENTAAMTLGGVWLPILRSLSRMRDDACLGKASRCQRSILCLTRARAQSWGGALSTEVMCLWVPPLTFLAVCLGHGLGQLSDRCRMTCLGVRPLSEAVLSALLRTQTWSPSYQSLQRAWRRM